MKIISFTETRNSLKAVLDGVVDDANTTIITRRDALGLLQQLDGNRLFTAFASQRRALAAFYRAISIG